MTGSESRSFYSCRNCLQPIAFRHDLLSKAFLGKSGPAFLFSEAMNIIVGNKEDKMLITGIYTVANISCNNCGELLGWKYLKAYEPKQMFKEGKFIIERAKIVKEY